MTQESSSFPYVFIEISIVTSVLCFVFLPVLGTFDISQRAIRIWLEYARWNILLPHVLGQGSCTLKFFFKKSLVF